MVTLYLINKYLKDTELQSYFKNFPLSDYTLQPNTGELPYQYANRLLTNIEDSISGSGKYQGFKDLEVAFVELTDMLTPNYTQVEVLLPESQLKRASNKTYHTSLHYAETYNIYAHRFKVHLYTACPCADIDDLDIKAWFYPNGIQPNAKRTEITTFIYHFPKPDPYSFNQKQVPSCSIDFAIPNDAKYYYEPAQFGYEFIHAEVLFLIRVINNAATCEYTPQTLHNKDRYTHVYMSVKQTYTGQTAAIQNLYNPQTHYASPMNTKSIKPKQLTQEQALHKRTIFDIDQVNHLQSYKLENE